MINKSIIKNSLNTAIILALSAPVAQAADFYFGENEDVQLSINSQISIGSSWATSDSRPSSYYIGNRFKDNINGVRGTGSIGPEDDDNLNYAKGDAFSTIIKGINDIELKKGNFGAFVRVKYWYDYELDKGDVYHGNVVNGYVPNTPLSDDGFSDFASFSGFELLDAYVYAGFEIGDVPVDVRLGRQVVSWGESTFIQGGINDINPLDVSALRRPGATLKEGLMPVGMLFANVGLTENISVEAFYQYEWQKTEIDGCGTFHSTHDYIATGCNYITATGNQDLANMSGEFLDDEWIIQNGVYAYRRPDVEPENGGQYGVAFRYFSEALNNTDFGFYYTNLHSRLPTINIIKKMHIDPADPFQPGITNAGYEVMRGLPAGTLAGQNIPGLLQVSQYDSGDHTQDMLNGGYEVAFPEDFKTYGLSFATNIGGVSLSGEIAYKPDQIFAINGNHGVGAALFDWGTQAVFNDIPNPPYNDNVGPFPIPALASEDVPFTVPLWNDSWKDVPAGESRPVSVKKDVTQIQITAIQFFDQVLGAQRITFIGEVGVTLVDGLESMAPRYQFGRNVGWDFPHFDERDKNAGFYTDTSWGYRTRAEFDYPDVFAGVSLKPILSWYHDVDGYGNQFQEGQTVAAIALEAIYAQQYSLTVSYTNFGGGDWSTDKDKDFLSVNFEVSY